MYLLDDVRAKLGLREFNDVVLELTDKRAQADVWFIEDILKYVIAKLILALDRFNSEVPETA